MRIAALAGNGAHAPPSSIVGFTSAYTSGATLVGLEVRGSTSGDPFVIGRDIAGLDSAAVRAIDLGAGLTVAGGTERPWERPDAPIAKVQSLGAMLDALPDGLEVVLSVPANVGDAAARRKLRDGVGALLRRRDLGDRAWLEVDGDEPAGAWGTALRIARRLDGAALSAWLAKPTAAGELVIATSAAGAALASGPRLAVGGTLVVELDDGLTDAELRGAIETVAGVADAVSFRDTLRLAEVVARWRTLEKATFAGTDENAGRFHFGYAKANRYGHVFQDDGVHIKLAPYDGRALFGDEADPTAAAISRLEERLYYALKDWPFYSGGGVGTAFPLDGDFSAEVDFSWTTASQATMCEMAVINPDPIKHRPGWRTGADGKRVANVPESMRDKNAFFDPHGCPPFVGAERDEDDGFRINWNLGTDYDNNQYGRPHGNGKSMAGRFRLDRRGPWFTSYFQDAANPDWVAVGSVRNDSMNARVYLRCSAKRWRQERTDGPGFMPIPDNEIVFKNLTIRSLLPARSR